MAESSALLREIDIYKIEREVTEALAAAKLGNLVPKPISLASLPLPSTALTEKATRYARDEVHPSVFAHCLRAYYFGTAIVQECLPADFGHDPQTFYLTAILHDISCTTQAFKESRVDFEFYGGLLARDFLLKEGAPKVMADTVMQGICRHTETDGNLAGHSPEGMMLIFGAQLDVLGNYSPLIHSHTIADVVASYPRQNFNNVFADLLEEEVRQKGYSKRVGSIEAGIIPIIRNNPIFTAYDTPPQTTIVKSDH